MPEHYNLFFLKSQYCKECKGKQEADARRQRKEATDQTRAEGKLAKKNEFKNTSTIKNKKGLRNVADSTTTANPHQVSKPRSMGQPQSMNQTYAVSPET